MAGTMAGTGGTGAIEESALGAWRSARILRLTIRLRRGVAPPVRDLSF